MHWFMSIISLGAEELMADHPLFHQLSTFEGGHKCIDVEWYQHITHQGYHYRDGIGVMWRPSPKEGTVVGVVVQVLACDTSHYLVVNKYQRFSDGAHCQYSEDGVRFVLPGMLSPDLHLVPLRHDNAMQPCFLVPQDEKMLLVPLQ
jgi:hypothetical protein